MFPVCSVTYVPGLYRAVGVLLWARRTPKLDVDALAWSLGTTWVFAVLYTLFGFTISPRIAVAGIVGQLSVVAVCVALLRDRQVRAQLPQAPVGWQPIVLVLIILTAGACLFPPVVQPWWGDPPAENLSLPFAAFVLHPHFDAGRHMPLYAVNPLTLIVEWLVIVAVGALSLYIAGRRSQDNPPREYAARRE